LTTRDFPSAAGASLATYPGRPLAREAVDLWSFDTERLRAASATDAWLACLQEDELARYAAHGTCAARRGYLGTRALARTALARYSSTPPHDLRFGKDHFGRPELIAPALPGLCFSLARAAGLAVGLFAFDREVGVDVERVAPIDAVALAERFFSAEETAVLSGLDPDARLARFYALWTLREAYLKARGVGLTLPLHQLLFRPTPSGGAAAEFGPAIGDDPARWQFRLIWLTRRHLAATCIRRRSKRTAIRIDRFAAGGPG